MKKIIFIIVISILFISCSSKKIKQDETTATQTAETTQDPPNVINTKPLDTPHPSWSYSGSSGPEFWGDLNPDYLLCKVGKQQSPINLIWSRPLKTGGEIKFDYKNSPLKLIDTGQTLQIHFQPGSFVSIRGDEYELSYAQFHSSSEHALSGDLSFKFNSLALTQKS